MLPNKAQGAIAAQAVVLGFDGRIIRDADRQLAVETPVQVTFARLPFAVMMMTPCDLDDFAFGFSLTEGIIETAADIRSVEVEPEAEGFRLHVDLVGARLHAHLARRRTLAGRTSCGL